MNPLFDTNSLSHSHERLEDGAVLLRVSPLPKRACWLKRWRESRRPRRFVISFTPGGYSMSVAMTNRGRLGRVSNRTGDRYDSMDPDTGAILACDARGSLTLLYARLPRPDSSTTIPTLA